MGILFILESGKMELKKILNEIKVFLFLLFVVLPFWFQILAKPIYTSNPSYNSAILPENSESVIFDFDSIKAVHTISENEFKNWKKNSGIELKDHNGWMDVIQSTTQNLIDSSIHEHFKIRTIIIRNPEWNLFLFPNNQLIIHTGTLDIIDKIIGTLPEKEKLIYRSQFISAHLSHELSHYFNSDVYNLYNQKKNTTVDGIKKLPILFSFIQELNADLGSIILMNNAGYDISYYSKFLKITQQISDKPEDKNKLNNKIISHYPHSHPKIDDRINHLSENEKVIFELARSISIITGTVNFSINLEDSLNIIENNYSIYPDNPEILKIIGILYHKAWEICSTAEDLKLQSITIPDSIKKINSGCNKNNNSKNMTLNEIKKSYYDKSIYFYKSSLKLAPEILILSNYSVLLSYSDLDIDKIKSIEYSNEIFNLNKGIRYANNLSIAYFQGGKINEALETLKIYAKLINDKFIKDNDLSEESRSKFEEIKINFRNQSFLIDEWVDYEAVVLLNLALIEYDYGREEISTSISEILFHYYSNQSTWVNYLVRKTNINYTENESKIEDWLPEGLRIGESQDSLDGKWKHPDRIENYQHYDIYYYYLYDTTLYIIDGIISKVVLYGKNSPPLVRGKVSINTGTAKEKLESVFGISSKNNNIIFIGRKSELELIFKNNKLLRATISCKFDK